VTARGTKTRNVGYDFGGDRDANALSPAMRKSDKRRDAVLGGQFNESAIFAA